MTSVRSLAAMALALCACTSSPPTEFVQLLHHTRADLASFKTYAWGVLSAAGTGESRLDDAFTDSVVRTSIEDELEVLGFERAPRGTDPEIIVSYAVGISPGQVDDTGHEPAYVRVYICYGSTGRLAWMGELKTKVTWDFAPETGRVIVREAIERIMREFKPLWS